MKALVMVLAFLASGVAFAAGTGTKVDSKAAKLECKAEAKKTGKRLTKAELKECVAGKTK